MSWFSNAIGLDKKREQSAARTKQAQTYGADPANPKNRFLTAMAGLGGGADRAEQRYEAQAGFDPGAAFQTFADGAWSGAQEGFKRNLQDLKGAAVGAGRLDTGFFDEDVGQLARDTQADFGRTLAGASLQVAGMQQSQNQFLGGYAADSRNRYLDAVTGQRDYEQGIEEGKANRKAQGKAGAWGAVGGIVGGVAGAATGRFGGGRP